MIAEIAELFGSRLAPRRGRTSVRRRRPLGRRIAIESLEPRQLLASDLGWIKIDLSQLDKTGVKPAYDIYIQGSANSSGQILQYDPTLVTPDGTGGLVFTTPLPSPVTFTSKNYTPVINEPKSIMLPFGRFGDVFPELFAGGSVKFSDDTTSTIASITANVTVGSWAPPLPSGQSGHWNPFPSNQVVGTPNVVMQSGNFSGSGVLDGTTLSGANGPAVSTSGMSIGSLVVGTVTTTNPNSYFFNNDGNGLPFPTSGAPAKVTKIGPDSRPGDVAATFSATSGQSSLNLGTDFLTVFSGGRSGGFATYVSAASKVAPTSGGGFVQQVTLGNLLSTSQVQPMDLSGFNPDSTAAEDQPIPKSFLVVDGVSGNFPIYGIDSFTITFADLVPATNTSVTFGTTVAATATSAITFTIDAGSSGIPGIIAGLSLGLQPTLSQTGQSTSALSITKLAIDETTNLITVTLSGSMDWSSGPMSVDLPPTGGFLPTTKWSAKDAKSNTIWARQTSAGSTSDPAISVNGSRIYFSLVAQGLQPPQMPYSQGSAGLSVTQFKPEDIWNGTVPLSQYLELTADALSGGPGNRDGLVYLDLSAVDGFFFPAALSTTVNNNNLVIGQVAETPPSGTTKYSAVSRQEILDAYDNFFAKPNPLFASTATASALQQAYARLHVKDKNGTTIGIQNPTFIDWSTPSSPAASALNAAWDNDLDALFTTSTNRVNLLGDNNSSAWSLVNDIAVSSQGSGYAVNDVITFTAPSSGGRAATARVTKVITNSGPNLGGIVEVEITDPGLYPKPYGPGKNDPKPMVVSITSSGQGATLTVKAMVAAATFYQGVPTAATGTASSSNPNTLVLTEYVGPSVVTPASATPPGQYKPPANFAYANLHATGAVFTVFDPRTVPASEAQAFNPGTNAGPPTPMAVGQQILGNFGVFASTTLNTTSSNRNYSFTGTDPWASGDALSQLKSLQRDIVWALNQGNGGIPAALTPTEPGWTTGYWTNEENWYPYPHISQDRKYQAQTPQNLYAQWVHTAGSAGGPAIGTDKYFATFPFGNVNPTQTNPSADYGQPTQAWGLNGAGTGPLMNQTYGFAYDEAPPHGIAGANVPSKFLPIPNAAGDTLTFQLVFGPWDTSTVSAVQTPTTFTIYTETGALAWKNDEGPLDVILNVPDPEEVIVTITAEPTASIQQPKFTWAGAEGVAATLVTNGSVIYLQGTKKEIVAAFNQAEAPLEFDYSKVPPANTAVNLTVSGWRKPSAASWTPFHSGFSVVDNVFPFRLAVNVPTAPQVGTIGIPAAFDLTAPVFGDSDPAATELAHVAIFSVSGSGSGTGHFTYASQVLGPSITSWTAGTSTEPSRPINGPNDGVPKSISLFGTISQINSYVMSAPPKGILFTPTSAGDSKIDVTLLRLAVSKTGNWILVASETKEMTVTAGSGG